MDHPKQAVKLHTLHAPTLKLPTIQSLINFSHQQVSYLLTQSQNTLTLYVLPSYVQLYSITLPYKMHKIYQIQDTIYITTFENTLFTFDFQTGKLSSKLKGYMIWSMIEFKDQILLACEDGIIRGYNEDWLLEGQTPSYEGKRALSLTCGQNEFWVSYSNGKVRGFDHTFQNKVEIEVREGQKCYAWCLTIFEDELFCGCSDGSVKIFETRFGTGIKNIKSHQADIYCLLKTKNAVYATGVDSRIACIQKLSNEWQISCYDRGQSHDIHSLIQLKENTILSVGMSTDIAIYKLEPSGKFKERHLRKEDTLKTKKIRHIVSIPQIPIFKFAKKMQGKFMFLFQHLNAVELVMLDQGLYTSLLKIDVKEQSCALSSNSAFLAYSTSDETKIFMINSDLTLEKVYNFEPAQVMTFKDNQLYYLNQNCQLNCFNLVSKENQYLGELQKSVYQHIEVNDQFLVIGSKVSNRITVYRQNQMYYNVPLVLGYVNVFMNFKLHNKQLYIVYDNNKFLSFDLLQKQLSTWSLNHLNSFPNYYIQHFNKFTDIIPIDGQKLILYCPFFYTVIDLQQQIPREIENDTKNPKCAYWQFVRRRSPILALTYQEGELLLIENDWSQLMSDVPGAVNTRNFGQ